MKKWIIFPLLFVLAFQVEVEAQFIKLADIEGEAQDAKHKGWSNIQSVDFSVSKPSTDGRQRSSTNFEDISITKIVDRASTKIVEKLANGKVLKTVTIDLVDSRRAVYMQIILTNARITNYQLSASSSSIPKESFSLNFETIEYIYKKEKFTWNTKTGKN